MTSERRGTDFRSLDEVPEASQVTKRQKGIQTDPFTDIGHEGRRIQTIAVDVNDEVDPEGPTDAALRSPPRLPLTLVVVGIFTVLEVGASINKIHSFCKRKTRHFTQVLIWSLRRERDSPS